MLPNSRESHAQNTLWESTESSNYFSISSVMRYSYTRHRGFPLGQRMLVLHINGVEDRVVEVLIAQGRPAQGIAVLKIRS